MSKELGYKQVKNVESRRTWDRDYYEAKAKERLAKGDDYQEKEDAPSRRSNKEEFQPAAAGAAGPAGSARAYLKVTFPAYEYSLFVLVLKHNIKVSARSAMLLHQVRAPHAGVYPVPFSSSTNIYIT